MKSCSRILPAVVVTLLAFPLALLMARPLASQTSAASSTPSSTSPSTASRTEIATELRSRLELALGEHLQVAGETTYSVLELPRFYAERAYQPAWTGEPMLMLARNLVRAIRESDREGLHPADYHLPALERLLGAVEIANANPPSAKLLSDLDLLLTDAFLTYAAHLVSGRVDPETLGPEWLAARREVDLVVVLRQTLVDRRPKQALQDLLPRHAGYARLRDALARYQSLDAWPSIPDGAVPLEDDDPRIPLLRLRLQATSDLTVEGDLRDAVRAFQQRHGLSPDGVIGAKTLRALNVPVEERRRQIELNLERWRWLPRDLGTRYVLVDIPAFALRVVEAGSTVLEMRVVVGRDYRRTPVMTDAIRYLVFNPTWEVPMKLAVEDKLPEIRKDLGFLAAQRIRVLLGWGSEERVIDPSTVDWSCLGRGNFPYRLRQEPGPLNALGRVKFMFPNKFDVYLHDTPGREVFNVSERAVSSGCVRLEKPLQLAEYLLQDVAGWDAAKIRKTLDQATTVTVSLPQVVPVHLQYWTASVNETGAVHFRQDIYERDAALAAALDVPPPGGSP